MPPSCTKPISRTTTKYLTKRSPHRNSRRAPQASCTTSNSNRFHSTTSRNHAPAATAANSVSGSSSSNTNSNTSSHSAKHQLISRHGTTRRQIFSRSSSDSLDRSFTTGNAILESPAVASASTTADSVGSSKAHFSPMSIQNAVGKKQQQKAASSNSITNRDDCNNTTSHHQQPKQQYVLNSGSRIHYFQNSGDASMQHYQRQAPGGMYSTTTAAESSSHHYDSIENIPPEHHFNEEVAAPEQATSSVDKSLSSAPKMVISPDNTSISLINSILEKEDESTQSILEIGESPIQWRDMELRNRDFLLMRLEMLMNRNYGLVCEYLGIEHDQEDVLELSVQDQNDATEYVHSVSNQVDDSLVQDAQPTTTTAPHTLEQLKQELHTFTDVVSFQYFGSGTTRLGTELFTTSDMSITAVLLEYESSFQENFANLEKQVAEMLGYSPQDESNSSSNAPPPSLEQVIESYSEKSDPQSKTFIMIHDGITDEKLGKYPIDYFMDYRRHMMEISMKLAEKGIKLFHYYTGRGTAVAHQVPSDPQRNIPATYHAMLDVLSVDDIIYIVGLQEKFYTYFHTGLVGHFAQTLHEQTGGVPIFLEHALRILMHCGVILISGYDVEQLVEETIPNYLVKHAPDLHNYRMRTAYDRNAAIILYALAYHEVVLSKDTLIDVDALHREVPITELLSQYPFYIKVVSRQEQTFRIVHCPYHTRLMESQLSELQKIDPRYQFYFPNLERTFSSENTFVMEQLVKFKRKKNTASASSILGMQYNDRMTKYSNQGNKEEYDPERVQSLNKLLSSVNVVSHDKILVDDVPNSSKQIRLKLDVYDEQVYHVMANSSMEETIQNALRAIGKESSQEDDGSWVFLDLRDQEVVGDIADFRTNSIYLFEKEGQYS